MPSSPSDLLLTWLRAAGEPTRLRLLALCAARELSVSDIAQIVGQSEPRVSRHLKILGDARLIERLRQGQ
jgi:DNA-binding transcriptional ArsR family regulator